MRMRIILTAVVLGLGIVGIAPAQQDGEKPSEPTARAKLRTRVATLRAEVELLQLEHEADVDLLKKLIHDMKQLDGMEAAKGPMKKQLEAIKEAAKRQGPDTDVGLPIPFPRTQTGDGDVEKMFLLDEATAKAFRPLLDRWKQEFVQKATELNEKRLELAELEARYNPTR